ncbi:MAG: VWA domain-containing protein [Prosthecobacter sp.]
MTFAHEHLLWFLLIIPALVGLKLWVDAHGSTAERLFTAARLRPALVIGRSLWLSWTVYALYSLAMTCLIVAVAQPRWGEEHLEVPDKGRNVFIAIDTSRSMLARDVTPDRLTRARLAANDLVTALAGERVGLLAFAGRAYLQAPLTTDHDAIIESLQAFDHTIIEWGGSNIGDLLDVTLRAIKNLPKGNFALVIFSDGGDADQNLASYIQRLTKAGVIVVTVGVGTEGGTLIPNPETAGDYIRDADGNVVRTQLQTGVLQQLADGTGGRFMKLGLQPLNRSALQPVLARLTEQESANRKTARPIERFAWPLGLGMFFLMLAWIISALPRPSPRPLVLALAVFAFAPQQPAQAANIGETLASIFQSGGPTPEEARTALEQGDFKNARDLYSKLLNDGRFNSARDELLYGMAATEHALTNYDGSVKNFSEALHTSDASLRARAHRGLGHTLYDQGVMGLAKQPKITIDRWTDSLRHLDAALELDPDNADLRENRDHVSKMLDELRKVTEEKEKQQQGQKGQKGQKGEKGQQGQKGEGEEGQEGDQDGQGQQGSDPNGGGEPKESEGKGEKKDEDDGIGGKDAKELPEGRLQAAGGDQKGEQPGQGADPGEGEEGSGEKQVAKRTESGDQRNPRTGYTPGEAQALLRQYMDEITAPMSNRYHTPPANKKDW